MIQDAIFLLGNLYLTSIAQGPPSNSDGSIKDVLINSDGTCGNGWICEHRWRQIYNMVEFRYVSANSLLKFFSTKHYFLKIEESKNYAQKAQTCSLKMNVLKFRNVVDGTAVEYWWDNGNNQIAWARGNKGFIAINNDNYDLSLNNYYVRTFQHTIHSTAENS